MWNKDLCEDVVLDVNYLEKTIENEVDSQVDGDYWIFLFIRIVLYIIRLR